MDEGAGMLSLSAEADFYTQGFHFQVLDFCSAEEEKPASEQQKAAAAAHAGPSMRLGAAGQARRVEDYCVARWRRQGLKVRREACLSIMHTRCDDFSVKAGLLWPCRPSRTCWQPRRKCLPASFATPKEAPVALFTSCLQDAEAVSKDGQCSCQGRGHELITNANMQARGVEKTGGPDPTIP